MNALNHFTKALGNNMSTKWAIQQSLAAKKYSYGKQQTKWQQAKNKKKKTHSSEMNSPTNENIIHWMSIKTAEKNTFISDLCEIKWK